jgi:hypothetical protein
MLRDFLLFVAALWHEWKALLTGGSIIALEALWMFSGKPPLPQAVNWLIVGLTMMLAAFLSWRKQWIEADREFVGLLPSELTDLARSGTMLHAKTLVGPYIGKRIKITGAIENIHSAAGYGFVWLKCGRARVILVIAIWRLKSFAPLPVGTSITVVGRITEIDRSDVRLNSVAIVSV